jgi:hypothetical protein
LTFLYDNRILIAGGDNMRTSVLKGAVTEESREYQAGERNGWKAVRQMKANGETGDMETLWTKAHYLVDVPKYIEDAPLQENRAGDPNIVYGMGFDTGTSDALKSLFDLEWD